MRIKFITIVALLFITAAIFGCSKSGNEPLPSSTVNQTIDEFREDFAFRAKLVSLDEAPGLIGHDIPLPAYLPDNYAVKEVYVGVGNDVAIILFSDKPIERIDKEPPNNPKDYPIHYIKCKMRMYISFEQDLRVVGGVVKPSLVPITLTPTDFYGDVPGGYIADRGVDVNGEIASIRLYAADEVADAEALIKIAESVY